MFARARARVSVCVQLQIGLYLNKTDVLLFSDGISFLVDGQDEQTLVPDGNILRERLGFNSDDIRIWSPGSYMAPFDDDVNITTNIIYHDENQLTIYVCHKYVLNI